MSSESTVLALKDRRSIYIYSESLVLLAHYSSANEASQRTFIPKSSLLSVCDKRVYDHTNKTVKSTRIFCKLFDCLVIIKSKQINAR